MKIVLWILNDACQRGLASKIHEIYPIAGIVAENRRTERKLTLRKLGESLLEKIFLRSIGGAWWGMLRYYESSYKQYPVTRRIDVENINSEEAYNFTKEIDPDLIIVSGTRLIKQKMLSLRPVIGILNLHTGLSPYIKGGPNCTNWCIATKQYHVIGNTIMWIDNGIDTGNLVSTEITEFDGTESLLDIHIKVMEHGQNLYLRAIRAICNGQPSNVPQETIGKGRTYYNKDWGLQEKISLIRNLRDFKKKVNSDAVNDLRQKIITVKI